MLRIASPQQRSFKPYQAAAADGHHGSVMIPQQYFSRDHVSEAGGNSVHFPPQTERSDGDSFKRADAFLGKMIKRQSNSFHPRRTRRSMPVNHFGRNAAFFSAMTLSTHVDVFEGGADFRSGNRVPRVRASVSSKCASMLVFTVRNEASFRQKRRWRPIVPPTYIPARTPSASTDCLASGAKEQCRHADV